MPHPLDGCRAKLARAKEHLDSLTAEVSGYEEHVHTETRIDFERSQVIVQITQLPDLPHRWSTIVGDILHNVRSTLDHLAFQLVGLDTGEYWRNTQFPIVDRPDEYRGSSRFQGTMERLSPEHRALVEWCQGYSRGWDYFSHPENSPLGLLRALSNTDKHRLVLGTALAIRIHGFEAVVTNLRDAQPGKTTYYLAEVPLQVGAEVLKLDLEITGPKPEVSLNVAMPLFVVFNIGGDLLRHLAELHEYVVEIIETFEPSF
jgi:hypothetical protein